MHLQVTEGTVTLNYLYYSLEGEKADSWGSDCGRAEPRVVTPGPLFGLCPIASRPPPAETSRMLWLALGSTGSRSQGHRAFRASHRPLL